jgi:hypothetical protein
MVYPLGRSGSGLKKQSAVSFLLRVSTISKRLPGGKSQSAPHPEKYDKTAQKRHT